MVGYLGFSLIGVPVVLLLCKQVYETGFYRGYMQGVKDGAEIVTECVLEDIKKHNNG